MNSRNAIEENASKSSLVDDSFSYHTRLDVAIYFIAVECRWFEFRRIPFVITLRKWFLMKQKWSNWCTEIQEL